MLLLLCFAEPLSAAAWSRSSKSLGGSQRVPTLGVLRVLLSLIVFSSFVASGELDRLSAALVLHVNSYA